MFCRVEVVEVRQLIAQGISENAIGFGHFVDAFLADNNVVAKILRGDPKPDNIRAIFPDVGVGSLGLFIDVLALFALGDFFPIGIHHKAVGQDALVGRRAIARERDQQ